ncbi:hypothetical protein HHI36_003972 [Cryptolaemus montrouzieri]|uniref:Uncharacterized protein n=1 Tax=Cryptolaemus montrouzieri TaxID=559131 RepID=A0ABD2NQU2_9CUCU
MSNNVSDNKHKETSAELKRSLHRKRGSIKTSITNFMKILSDWETDPDSPDPNYLEASLETLQRSFNRFDDRLDQLEEIDPIEETKRTEYEDSYNKPVGKTRRFFREAAKVPPHLSAPITRMQPSLPNCDSNESKIINGAPSGNISQQLPLTDINNNTIEPLADQEGIQRPICHFTNNLDLTKFWEIEEGKWNDTCM